MDRVELPHTAIVVAETLLRRVLGTGLQLSIRCSDYSVDLVAGETLSGPMEVGHLHNIYCGCKPLLPLAIAHLIEERLIAVDEPIEHLLGAGNPLVPPWPTTLNDILCHTAGLTQPVAIVWRMTPVGERAALIDYSGGTPAAGYSELLGGLLLEAVIERVTGQDAATLITNRILVPLGLEDGIIFDVATRLSLIMPRVRVPFGGLPDEAIPLLSERMPSQVIDLRPAFGGLASMSAMSSLYAVLGALYDGVEHPGLPSASTFRSMIDRRRGVYFDAIMRRDVDFGGGFMRDIGAGGLYDDVSANSFGHTAGFITNVAFHDPVGDVSLAFYVNGIISDARATRGERNAIVSAVYQDLRDAHLLQVAQ